MSQKLNKANKTFIENADYTILFSPRVLSVTKVVSVGSPRLKIQYFKREFCFKWKNWELCVWDTQLFQGCLEKIFNSSIDDFRDKNVFIGTKMYSFLSTWHNLMVFAIPMKSSCIDDESSAFNLGMLGLPYRDRFPTRCHVFSSCRCSVDVDLNPSSRWKPKCKILNHNRII